VRAQSLWSYHSANPLNRYSVYISPDGKVFRSRHDVLEYHKNSIEGTDFDIAGRMRALRQMQDFPAGDMFGSGV